jgi:hypothetical protein
MTRLDNWQANLSDLIRAREKEPFDIVNFNCLMWALEAVEAITGESHYKLFAGKFKTVKGAARVLRIKGKVETSAQFLENLLGERQHIFFVRKGDIVITDSQDPLLTLPSDVALFGSPVGVCYGELTYFVGEAGLVSFQTLQLGSNTYGLHC